MNSRPISPYNYSGAIAHGNWNPNHTTSVAIVYPPGQLTTPWPWLAASMGLSLVLAAYSVISAPNLSSPSGFKFSRICATASVTINSIRVIALIPLFSRIGKTGYAPASSSVAMLLLSCASTFLSGSTWFFLGSFFYFLLLLDFIIVFILLTLRNFAGFGNGFWYGRRILYGGTCPQKVANCDPPKRAVDAIGCNPGLVPFTGESLGDSFVSAENRSVDAEFTLGLFVNVLAAGVLVVFLIGLCSKSCLIMPRLAKRSSVPSNTKKERVKELFWVPFDKAQESNVVLGSRPAENNKREEAVGGCTCCLFIFMVIVAVITLTLNIMFQPKPESFSFYDSFGPFTRQSQLPNKTPKLTLDPINNVTSWTDCFTVQAPADRLGFWDVWKSEKENAAAKYIAVV